MSTVFLLFNLLCVIIIVHQEGFRNSGESKRSRFENHGKSKIVGIAVHASCTVVVVMFLCYVVVMHLSKLFPIRH